MSPLVSPPRQPDFFRGDSELRQGGRHSSSPVKPGPQAARPSLPRALLAKEVAEPAQIWGDRDAPLGGGEGVREPVAVSNAPS